MIELQLCLHFWHCDASLRAMASSNGLVMIPRHWWINQSTLTDINNAVQCFHTEWAIFIETGVHNHFSLPHQHSMTHYLTLIKMFGAPNGLYSSITKSWHIKAGNEPWQHSNHYEALGQMLVTNQWLDNVMIFLLFHNLSLFVFPHCCHIFFSIYHYEYISLLLVVHPLHSHILVLWPRSTPFLLTTGREYSFYLCSLVISDNISTSQLSHADYSFYYSSSSNVLSDSMMTCPLHIYSVSFVYYLLTLVRCNPA